MLAGLLSLAVTVVATVGLGTAQAAAPQILNNTQWLESTAAATNGAPASARSVTVSLMVKHDVGRKITNIKVDDDYDGTDNTASKTAKPLSGTQAQQPTIVNGYDYTRVTYTYQAPAGSDVNCPFLGSGDKYQVRPIRIRAIDDNGQESATANANVTFIRYDCNAREDAPVILQHGQNKTSIEVGETVNFTLTGDDSDGGLTSNRDFGGIEYRLRRLSDGATTGTTKLCFGNSDNTERNFNVTFPRRGRWVVEALLWNNNSCDYLELSGTWWRLGAVDVNSPAASSPNITLGASAPGNPARPQIGSTMTITATVNDSSDSGEGGAAQNIEWDLDGNNVYEDASLGDWKTGLTTPQRQRTINTAGLAPGLYTVRARVGDNGALGGADNIRRTKVATMTFRVDTPPVATPGNAQTVTEAPVSVPLSGTDADGDSLTYSIATPAAHGSVTGSGATRTYTPATGYAGLDSFVFTANDGYGGTSNATIGLRVDPDLRNVTGPSGVRDSRGATIGFGSAATGATFECQLDGAGWLPCVAPLQLSDLADGDHNLKIRVSANGLTNPDESELDWTADAFPKVQVTDAPDALTSQTAAAVEFNTSEDGSTATPTTECRLDTLDWVPCVSPVSYEDLDDGDHSIQIRATDAFGKQKIETVEWAVLTAGGSTAIEAPLPPSYTRETSAEINFSASGNTDHTECSLDGDSWQICTSPVSLTGLAEGQHTLRVRSVDPLGNPGGQPARVSWVVDRTPPIVTILSGPQGPTVNAPAAFTFNASESFSRFECKVDDGAYETCSSPFDLPAGLDDGDHTFRVAAVDLAGNRSLAPQRSFKLLSAAPAVVITDGPAEGSTVRGSAAEFKVDSASAIAGLECKVDQGGYAPCTSPVSVTGLADGPHTFSVRAIDEVGNRSDEPAVRHWIVDTTAPATSITSGPDAESREAIAQFTFGSSETGSTFECSVDLGAYSACVSPVELTGLTDGPHEFRVRATDPVGNTDPSPASRAWTVDTSPLTPADPPLADPEEGECDFKLEREKCGDPYLVAAARSTYRKKRGKGSIKIDLDSGGVALAKIVARTPSGLQTRAYSGKAGRKVGTVSLTGTVRQKLNLKLPAKVRVNNVVAGAKGGVKVTLNQRSVVVTNLPPGVTGAKIRLKSTKGLGFHATLCGTRAWRAVLTDFGTNTRIVDTKGDTTCVRKGTR